MAEYTRRVQILLTDEQYEFLQELSRTRQRSAGELLRTAFEEVYRPAHSIRELQVLADLGTRSFLAGESAGIQAALLAGQEPVPGPGTPGDVAGS